MATLTIDSFDNFNGDERELLQFENDVFVDDHPFYLDDGDPMEMEDAEPLAFDEEEAYPHALDEKNLEHGHRDAWDYLEDEYEHTYHLW